MRAIRFDGKRAQLDELDVPDVPDEALVRVLAVGVCNTDLEIVQGYAGFRGTLGHEFVGLVERAADASLVGKRVVGEINCGCGVCNLCRSGDARHCPARTVLGIVGRDGAMADFVALPERNLIPVPDEVETCEAVFVEPLAAACEILDQIDIDARTRVALVGDGKLGLLVGQVLATTGARVTAYGRHEHKLNILASRGIDTVCADDCVDAGCEPSAEVPSAYDVVVEASGSPKGLSLAQRLVRPRGTIVLKSTIHGALTFDATSLVVDEVTIVGSRCGRFAPALELLHAGRVDVQSLISERMSLADGPAVLEAAARPGALKVIVETARD